MSTSLPTAASSTVLAGIEFDPKNFDLFPAVIVVVDRSARLVYQNREAEAFSGLSLEAAELGWLHSIHSADQAAVIKNLQQCFTHRSPCAIEARFRRCDGAERWLALHEHPLTDSGGEVLYLMGLGYDVTEQRAERIDRTSHAEEETARLRRIVEATTECVATLTPAGQLTYLNEAARKQIGFEADQPLDGVSISQLHPPWAFEIIDKEAIGVAMEEGRWEGETAILNTAGQEVPVAQVIVAHHGSDRRVEFLSTIMRDISERKREEITRMEWANRYDAAIRASGQLLFDWNSFTNDITYAGGVEHFLGYTVREMAGGLDRFRQLILPEDLAAFDIEIQRVTVTRDPFRLNFKLQRKEGMILDIAAKGFFFLDREGNIGRMVGFFADVTAQKAAQEAVARAQENLELRVEQRTAELARAYTVIRDRAHQQEAVAQLGQRALVGADLVTLLKQAAGLVRRILGVDFCSILQLSDDGLTLQATAQAGWLDGDDSRFVPSDRNSQSGYTLLVREPVIVEDMATETRFEVSEIVKRHGVTSGVSVVIEATDAPLGVLTAFSVGPRTFVQDDVHFLQSLANVLTAAIERRQAEEKIRLAREQAETANRAKSDFLSRMSHELRTPLNAILGFTQLLELDSLSASQIESVEHISRAGQHLLSLINEVLDIARIESRRFAMVAEPIVIHQFLRDAVELIRPLASRHHITATLESNPDERLELMADPQRLKQVLLNLLSNAVKYNRPGGTVTVRYSTTADHVRIEVADNGNGISEENMPRLFHPFERLGAEATEIEGTGIGLALSRGIVAALNGEIGAESVEGQGSTFWITLPLAPPGDLHVFEAPPVVAALPPPEPEPPAVQQTHLLYIEDQDLNLRLVERILEMRKDYKLLTAMQGGLGLELAREHHPDIILLDINLPDMTGDEVLRRLKADPSVSDIPVLMVSADAMGDRIEQMMSLGAAGYLTKPYRVAEFLRVIAEVLAR